MTNDLNVIGIDISKQHLDVAIGDNIFRLPYDDQGLAELVKRAQRARPDLVLLEATGHLESQAAGVLAAQGLPVVVVKSAILPVPLAGWPRPTASMHPSYVRSVKPSGPRYDR